MAEVIEIRERLEILCNAIVNFFLTCFLLQIPGNK